MNVQIDQLVKSLLEKDSLDHCSLQEVKEFAENNPYFGAAQLLLTKKMQIEKAEEYNEQLQKTFTFFHNPLWVKKILDDSGNATITEKKTVPNNDSVQDLISSPPVEAETLEDKVIQPDFEPDATDFIVKESAEPLTELPTFKFEPVTPANNDLLFEPFHTVDYFASQGINFKEEEKPADKFGQQLKSFTDWLKTMKRLPVVEESGSEKPIAEKKVEELAEHSITERDVLTIAMAEVWEKQGNNAKAIDIYNKLSLLEPSKSPYFAAKIEELKKIN